LNIKVGFVSLGCSKNAIDCELMLSRLINAGIEIVDEDIFADVMIVNTCAFIQSAKEEAIENIMDLSWLKKNRNLKGIIVTGCMAQRYFDEIKTSMPEVDAVLGLGAETDIVEAVKAVYAGNNYYKTTCPEDLVIEGDRVLTTPEYLAYIKIAEGCNNHCTYCAIGNIRGKFRSRSIESILKEAKDLYDLGVKELCIVAQDTTMYGIDLYGEYALPKLLTALCESKDFSFEWIRLLYCYPDKITDELISVMKKYDNIVKYIDMPIQHISDKILKAMNRSSNSEQINEAVTKLRKEIPEIIIRTTVLTGFPGESDSDYSQLLKYVKATKFERLGAFAYSREEGTPAYKMNGQITKKTKALRLDNLMHTQYTVIEEYNALQVGKTFKVLCEGYDSVSGMYYGRSYAHAPEVDGRIYFTSRRKIAEGVFLDVEIDGVCDYDLIGKAVLK